MERRVPRNRLLAAATAIATLMMAQLLDVPSGRAAEPVKVDFTSANAEATPIAGYLMRPGTDDAPRPAIVALHGCGGLYNAKGRISSRHSDWAERWVGQGYVVLLVDSFGPRGIDQICTVRDRTINPRGRALDAIAAGRYLAAQPFVDKARIALIGWSNGGSTTLWAVGDAAREGDLPFRVAIAFYPGCRTPSESKSFKPRLPLTILMGAADDWTPVEPCRALAERGMATLIEYPGAYHGFDSPKSPLRVRKGIAFSKSGTGEVHVGFDPVAHAKSIEDVTRILAEGLKP